MSTFQVKQGNAAVVLKEIAPNTVDLTVTSPPYDDLRDYNGGITGWGSHVWREVIEHLFRLTKPGGVVVWVVGDATVKGSESGTSFKQALYAMECGFRLHDTMIYEKNTSTFPARRSGSRYTQIFEYMFIFSKGAPKTANLIADKPNRWAGATNWGKNTQRGKDGELVETKKIKPVPDYSPRNNIWRYVVGGGFASKDKKAHGHPAIFPELLAEDHILTWSEEGDTVLDPFSGSGTVGVCCARLGRSFIGVELDPGYAELSLSRIADELTKRPE